MWQLGWEGGLRRNGYMYIYSWVTLLCTWNYHNIINQLYSIYFLFSSVRLLSRVQLFATPWIAARQASLSITNSRSSLRLKSIKSVMPSSHLILWRPLLLLPPIPPSIRVFSNESTLRMRWPKYWRFSFSIIPSKEIPGLISFRMDWWDLLAVQRTLKSLLQHHSSKASILRHSAFFTVQLSHPYMTTGKTIALTRRTFVGKVMSLLLNMLSRLVITFLKFLIKKKVLFKWSFLKADDHLSKVTALFLLTSLFLLDFSLLIFIMQCLKPKVCNCLFTHLSLLPISSMKSKTFLFITVFWVPPIVLFT